MPIIIRCGAKEITATVDPLPQEPKEADTTSAGAGDASATEESASIAPLRTVGELRQFITSEGGYTPDSKLKIVFRGKCLGEAADEPLVNYHFKWGEKLMVLGGGKVPVFQDDAGFKELTSYEQKHLIPLKALFAKNKEDLGELERDFLGGPIRLEMINRMQKRLDSFTDVAMRHIESIDGLSIVSDITPTEHSQRNREKRKSMVVEIQQLLSQNDKFSFRLSQYRDRADNPE